MVMLVILLNDIYGQPFEVLNKEMELYPTGYKVYVD